ncbi:hypothetical protein SANA_14400 [Gottschalkiaceae bacterium SANA]|jgi:hypothetical protein|nr:hypothetical protein SANA_14400 [Gottschalkiaceae bacterium SANA]
MKIEFINHPYVFTDAGTRHEIKEIHGIPRVGAVLDADLNVLGSSMDTDCVSGVCPIK